MSIEARQIQETLYSYAAILNFTPSLQGLRAKFGACSVQNAQLLHKTRKQATLQARVFTYAWHCRNDPSWRWSRDSFKNQLLMGWGKYQITCFHMQAIHFKCKE